ncbi:MAG: N-acetylmuramoyl-L-alanine amidase [Hyphomicrobium sp.]
MIFQTMRPFAPLAIIACLALCTSAVLAAEPASVEVAEAKPAVSPPAKAEPVKAEATLVSHPLRTRFLIGVPRTVEFQVFSLSSPNRVIVDLPDVALQLPGAPEGKAAGLVSSFRAGESAPGKARIVIEMTEPVVVQSAKIEKGRDGNSQQLALDIVPAHALSKANRRLTFKTAASGLGGSNLQPPLPQLAERPSVKAAKSYKPIIVIDPGHGGHDSGATKNGAVEKDVVLAFAKTLRDKLEATGRYKIQMTRDTDVFIPLSDRVDFAERNKAALFIAVHADYASTKARGATIYSLRDGVANSLKRSAKGEVSNNVLSSSEVTQVKSASGGEGDVSAVRNILADLAQREVDATQERTSVFSRAVIENMGETTTMRDDPDQQAGFRVLKTAKFPSVLIELAYVTNKEDAEQLKSETWRDKVSDSIKTAVENYFSNQISRLPM